MSSQRDQVVRAYAKLKALEETMSKGMVPEHQVHQYNRALDELSEAGFDVEEWRIQAHVLTAISHSGSGTRYAPESMMRPRLIAVLRYFEISTSAEKRDIGFRGPTR